MRIMDLTEATTLANGDYFPFHPDEIEIDQRISWANIKAGLTAFPLLDGTRAFTGAQTFSAGIVAGILRPEINSTTALRVQDAAGSTNVLTFDTTNNDVSRGGVPLSDNSLVSRNYVTAKAMNLFVNGSGLLGNNYNMPSFTYDGIDARGAGSFKFTGPGLLYSSEYMAVDIEKYYRAVLWAKAGDIGGANYDPSNLHYNGIAPFDADRLAIMPKYYMIFSGSAQTTLAAALNIGDTTMSLTSAAGWQNAGQYYERQFIWWPYTNLSGYSYPNYSYSRNSSSDKSAYNIGNGAWGVGGISGNTITLSAPWPGPALPSGAPVMNTSDGAAFKYILMPGVSVPNSWARYEGYIGSVDQTNTNQTKFPVGTAFVKLVFVLSTAAGSTVRYSNLWLSELSVRNLERFDTNGDLVLQSYSSGTRPAAGTAGRQIWNTSTGKANFDTGSGWTLADGTAA